MVTTMKKYYLSRITCHYRFFTLVGSQQNLTPPPFW
jgi:hypothetical protein